MFLYFFLREGKNCFSATKVLRSAAEKYPFFCFLFSERGKTVFRTQVLRSAAEKYSFFPYSSAIATEGYTRTDPFSKNSSITPRYLSRIPQTFLAPLFFKGQTTIYPCFPFYTVTNCIGRSNHIYPVGRGLAPADFFAFYRQNIIVIVEMIRRR